MFVSKIKRSREYLLNSDQTSERQLQAGGYDMGVKTCMLCRMMNSFGANIRRLRRLRSPPALTPRGYINSSFSGYEWWSAAFSWSCCVDQLRSTDSLVKAFSRSLLVKLKLSRNGWLLLLKEPTIQRCSRFHPQLNIISIIDLWPVKLSGDFGSICF